MDFPADRLSAYREHRPAAYRHLTCHAPWRSMYFGISGMVTACCYNHSQPLGWYEAGKPLAGIWRSAQAEALRAQFDEAHMANGCGRCAKQLEAGNYEGMLTTYFDGQCSAAVLSGERPAVPGYPEMLELELANTCNLECPMCTEVLSSAIAARKGISAAPSVYGDDFAEQLREFLPHLRTIHFLGGEPFLIKPYYPIWDLIAEVNPKIICQITSNATVLNKRVEEVLRKVPVELNLSIDAITPAVYEAVRVNARFESVMKNLEWFLDNRWRMRFFSMSACVMPMNRFDIPNLLEFCNRRRVELFFNTVFDPREHSMLSLSEGELVSLAGFYRDFQFQADFLPVNRERFDGLIAMVDGWLESRRRGESSDFRPMHARKLPPPDKGLLLDRIRANCGEGEYPEIARRLDSLLERFEDRELRDRIISECLLQDVAVVTGELRQRSPDDLAEGIRSDLAPKTGEGAVP